MKKSDIVPMPMFFDRYINMVVEDDLLKAFVISVKELDMLDLNVLKKVGNKTYQAGKWTVNDIFQHIVDNERIQSYRAMRIARKDSTPLPGYDEQLFGDNANANNRNLQDIIEELICLRTSTIQLYKSFDDTSIKNAGISFNQTITPLALGFVIVGHQQHHLSFIKEKYLPLIASK